MNKLFLFFLFLLPLIANCQYPGQADSPGTTAIFKDSSILTNWAAQVIAFNPGKEDTAVVSSIDASYGLSAAAIGEAEGTSTEVVSLGDGGFIILGFEYPIRNGAGFDFAVFENSFSHDYLEFAHVEVSTDGLNFVRIPSVCLIDNSTQTPTYSNSDPTKVHNLAGKYIQGYGTPFDLEDIVDSTGINLDSINFIKIIDVVGTIDPAYGSFDAEGNIINDPYPTEFESGGFDLDAVGVIHENRADLGQEEYELEVNIFPNPVSSSFQIKGISQESIYSIYGVDGRLIQQGRANPKAPIYLIGENYTPGIYFIQVETQGLRSTMIKFVFSPEY